MTENKYHFGREIIYNLRSCHAISSKVYLHWLDKLNEEEELTLTDVSQQRELLKSDCKCGMCDKEKELDGHNCCEDCGGIAF